MADTLEDSAAVIGFEQCMALLVGPLAELSAAVAQGHPFDWSAAEAVLFCVRYRRGRNVLWCVCVCIRGYVCVCKCVSVCVIVRAGGGGASEIELSAAVAHGHPFDWLAAEAVLFCVRYRRGRNVLWCVCMYTCVYII